MASGPKLNLGVLERKVAYSGEGISVKSLENVIRRRRLVKSLRHQRPGPDRERRPALSILRTCS